MQSVASAFVLLKGTLSIFSLATELHAFLLLPTYLYRYCKLKAISNKEIKAAAIPVTGLASLVLLLFGLVCSLELQHSIAQNLTMA